MRAVKSSPGPNGAAFLKNVFSPGLELNGFFVVYHANANGGITHPSMRLKRPIRINVANLACVSWVSIPRGRENWSQQVSSAEMLVSLDKRELLSPVDNTVDNLPTIGLVGWMSYAHKKKKDKEGIREP